MRLKDEELRKLLHDNTSLKPEAPGRARKGLKEGTGGKYHVARKEDRFYDGILYQSKKEADYAKRLDLLKAAGDILFFLRQIPFQLPETIYRLDFVTFAVAQGYEPGAWNIHWIEIKGMETPLSLLKRKQCQAIYGIVIEVV